MIVKQLYVEKDTHLGGVVKFGFVHLPIHSELYLVKEIKQKFRFFGIPFNLTTGMDMFAIPSEVVSLFSYAHYTEDFSTLDLDAYKKRTIEVGKDLRKNMLDKLATSDLDEVEKQKMVERVRKDEKHVRMLFEELNDKEKEQVQTFLKNDYQPLYKIVSGATTTIYLARVLDDRVSIYAVDLLSVRTKKLLASVKSFYITKRYMDEFLIKINEKGGYLL